MRPIETIKIPLWPINATCEIPFCTRPIANMIRYQPGQRRSVWTPPNIAWRADTSDVTLPLWLYDPWPKSRTHISDIAQMLH